MQVLAVLDKHRVHTCPRRLAHIYTCLLGRHCPFCSRMDQGPGEARVGRKSQAESKEKGHCVSNIHLARARRLLAQVTTDPSS